MRALLIWLFAAASLLAQQQPAPCLSRPEAERPYSRDRLLAVVQAQTPARAEYLIRTCGVQERYSAAFEAEVRRAGAAENVLAALRDVAVKPVEVVTNPKDGLAYVHIPAGSFRMGCASPGDEPCDDREKPAREVRISKPFWMGQTEVTVGAYWRFTAATGREMPPEPRFNEGWRIQSLPMVNVTWSDALNYCEWAGELRLPTEAQWEYAARAGTTGARYGILNEIAWSGLSAEKGAPQPAGGKAPNGFRLYDMFGNVMEWTNDWYAEPFPKASPVTDPSGPAAGDTKVLRGGAWSLSSFFVRASSRSQGAPGSRGFVAGFRCAGEKLPTAPPRP